MRYVFLLVVLLFIACACQPSKDNLSKKIDASLVKYMQDWALKTQKQLVEFEVKTIDFEEIGEGKIDTIRRKNKADFINLYAKMYREYMQHGEERHISASTSSFKSLAELEEKQSRDWFEKAKKFQDTLKIYTAEDSIIAERIKRRKENPKLYYYTNTYVKSIMGSETQTDTLHFVLTKDYKVVKL